MNRESHARSDEQEFVRIFRQEGLVAMEKVFDELVPAGKTLRLNKLEVDLGRISLTGTSDKWQATIADAFREALQKQISEEYEQRSEGIFETPEMAAERSWIFFLEYGTLPWWAPKTELADWEFAVLTFISAQHPARWSHLLTFLKQQRQAFERLLNQNSAAFQWALLQILCKPHCEISAASKRAISTLIDSRIGVRDFLGQIWAALLTGSAKQLFEHIDAIVQKVAHLTDAPMLTDILVKTLHESNPIKPVSGNTLISIPGRSEKSAPPADEPLYFKNAGLVIMAPFLPAFFENLGYIRQRTFVDTGSQNRAVLALHYLATGVAGAMEYDLTFEKFLCSVPAWQPLNADLTLTEYEIEEADELLRTVVSHWSGLGTCGPANFRHMFLSRAGKLSTRAEEWVLHVEKSTFDILFRSLPWGISLIRLPWMNQFLNVEWSY